MRVIAALALLMLAGCAEQRGGAGALSTRRAALADGDPCGAVGTAGCCDGSDLYYCNSGSLAHLACDGGCGWDAANSWYDCGFAGEDPSGEVPLACPGGGCGDLTMEGCCDGSTLRYCDGDAAKERACSGGCGWRAGKGYYDCGGAGADPSGEHPLSCDGGCTPDCAGKSCGPDGCGGSCGACEGGSCVDGTCKQGCKPDCAGKACGPDGCGSTCGACPGGTSCTPAGQCEASSGGCGAVGQAGTCDGSVLQWCEGGVLYTYDCAKQGKSCGMDDAQGAYDCKDEGGCAPSCAGKDCGDDGCGGSCGSCGAGEVCSGGACESTGGPCEPDCGGKDCGPDGCGGMCGTCPSGGACEDGACASAGGCAPDCAGKQCGGDGCGGSCGTCSAGYECRTNQCMSTVPLGGGGAGGGTGGTSGDVEAPAAAGGCAAAPSTGGGPWLLALLLVALGAGRALGRRGWQRRC